jgi:ABC-type glycerol-3-phosphate transport system permease component
VTGANEWIEKWRIALPLSLPGLVTPAVLSFVGTWNSYVCLQVVIQDRVRQLISFGLWQLSRSVGGSFEHRAG